MSESESENMQTIRLEASRRGWLLLRNNSGAYFDKHGRIIRYGLGNDSAKVNAAIKSPDLIGIRTVTITPDMVGMTIGQFVAIETKKKGWRMDKTAKAQANFGKIITERGGIFQFATGPGDITW